MSSFHLEDALVGAIPGIILYDVSAGSPNFVVDGRLLASGAVTSALTVQIHEKQRILETLPSVIMGGAYIGSRLAGLSASRSGLIAAVAYIAVAKLQPERHTLYDAPFLTRLGARGRQLPHTVHGDITRDRPV